MKKRTFCNFADQCLCVNRVNNVYDDFALFYKMIYNSSFLVQFDGQSLSKGEITKQNFYSCVEYERPI